MLCFGISDFPDFNRKKYFNLGSLQNVGDDGLEAFVSFDFSTVLLS